MKWMMNVRLACHNLWQNKTRTILTVIVLAVMSILVMVLLNFSMNYITAVSKNFNVYLQEKGEEMRIGTMYNQAEQRSEKFSIEDANKIIEVADKYAQYVSGVRVETNGFVSIPRSNSMDNQNSNDIIYDELQVRPYIAGYSMFSNNDYLVAGDMWKENESEDSIWITQTYLRKNYLDDLKVGDKIKLYSAGTHKDLGEFTVKGVLTLENSGNGQDRYVDMYIPLKCFDGNPLSYSGSSTPEEEMLYRDNRVITGMEIYFTPDSTVDYTAADMIGLSNFEKELQAVNENNLSVWSNSIGNLKTGIIIFIALLLVSLFISVIIILLSIGCAANTINISVEQNRKFIGMMKAIGMRDKTVRSMIKWQAFLMTAMAVIVGLIGVAAFLPLNKMMITMMMEMTFYDLAEPIIISTISVVPPILTVFILFGFIVLFTRKSLNKISKMDVMSVISEVN